tara:strand:+ start:2343 stop:3674 length:1332 start_codon:yes stop_codon:yes gene_type:complete
MKKLLFILLLVPIMLIGQPQQIFFSPFIDISSNSDGYGRPRIVLTSDNSPLIIWRKDSSPKVLRASKWNGTNFSPPYDILQAGILPNSWDGPEIAAKGDTIYVVFTSTATQQNSIMLIKSFDGGLTFSDTLRVSDNNPNHKYRMANVVVNSNGNPVVSYMQYLLNWMEPKQMVNVSNNFGVTFIGAVDGSELSNGEPCDCCKSSLVSKDDNLFLLFRNNDNNERNSFITKSIDGGLSFSLIADLDDYDWILNSCPATSPKGVIVDDSLIIVKRSGATGNNEIVCSSVNMRDLTYYYNNNIDFISGTLQDYPEISSSSDTIVTVWQDNRTGSQDCYVSISTVGASNLSGSILFTDSTSIGQKTDPHVVYAKGDIHLVYLDYSQHKIVYVKGSFDPISGILNTTEKSNYLSKVFDLTGRETKERDNELLFYINDEGIVEKKIIID